jgi:hypothetical protein
MYFLGLLGILEKEMILKRFGGTLEEPSLSDYQDDNGATPTSNTAAADDTSKTPTDTNIPTSTTTTTTTTNTTTTTTAVQPPSKPRSSSFKLWGSSSGSSSTVTTTTVKEKERSDKDKGSTALDADAQNTHVTVTELWRAPSSLELDALKTSFMMWGQTNAASKNSAAGSFVKGGQMHQQQESALSLRDSIAN